MEFFIDHQELANLVVSYIAHICKVLASIPICNLSHYRRYSGWCFLHFHSLSPKSFRPVKSTSKCSSSLLFDNLSQYQYVLSATESWIQISLIFGAVQF